MVFYWFSIFHVHYNEMCILSCLAVQTCLLDHFRERNLHVNNGKQSELRKRRLFSFDLAALQTNATAEQMWIGRPVCQLACCQRWPRILIACGSSVSALAVFRWRAAMIRILQGAAQGDWSGQLHCSAMPINGCADSSFACRATSAARASMGCAVTMALINRTREFSVWH